MPTTLRKKLSSFLLSFSVISFPVGAWEIGLEQGQSNSYLANPEYYTESKYSAVTLRKDHVELIQGSWYGESYGRFVGVSGAYRTSGKTFFDGSFGVVKLIDHQTEQLDGNKQFTFSIGVGRRFDDLSVSVKFRHFSNGNTEGKNWGQDFIMFYIGY